MTPELFVYPPPYLSSLVLAGFLHNRHATNSLGVWIFQFVRFTLYCSVSIMHVETSFPRVTAPSRERHGPLFLWPITGMCNRGVPAACRACSDVLVIQSVTVKQVSSCESHTSFSCRWQLSCALLKAEISSLDGCNVRFFALGPL